MKVLGYILPIGGIILSICLIIWRETIGDMLGEADWMRKVGGVYYVVVFIAIIIFFWSLAELTGTTSIFLSPLKHLIPWSTEEPAMVEGF